MKKTILLILFFTLGAALFYKNRSNEFTTSKIVIDPPQTQSNVYQQIKSKRIMVASLAKDPEDNHSQNKFNAAMALYGKDNAKVKILLEESLQLDSGNLAALGLLSGIVLNEGERLEARELAIRCLSIDLKNKDCHETLISSFTRYGEFEEAYRYLSDCLSENPDNVTCLGGLETYYLHAGRLQDAQDVLDHLQKLSPDSMWTDIAAAGYFEQSGDLAQAKTHYERACEEGQAFACAQVKKLEH